MKITHCENCNGKGFNFGGIEREETNEVNVKEIKNDFSPCKFCQGTGHIITETKSPI